jgi:hypothetical protein
MTIYFPVFPKFAARPRATVTLAAAFSNITPSLAIIKPQLGWKTTAGCGDRQAGPYSRFALNLSAATAKSAKPAPCKTHRRQKTGCDEQDAPLIEEMRHMLVKRKANSLHAAARMVASDGSKVAGVCDLESKVLRLVDGYWEKYGDTDP